MALEPTKHTWVSPNSAQGLVVVVVVECTHFSSFKEQYFIHKKYNTCKFIVEIVMINTEINNYIQ